VGARRVGDHGRAGTRRCAAEDGNILVLSAVVLPLLLLICAIAIDVGYWWVNGKKAQMAADACALAAAQELPHTYDDMDNCAIAAGQGDYVLVHLPHQTSPDAEALHLSTRVRSPYDGDASMVEATVRMRVGTFFGRIVGMPWLELERRAVAERLVGETKLAVFAGSTDCEKGLRIDGDNITVTGHLHSNGEYTVNGAARPNHFRATSGTYALENCPPETQPPGPPPEAAGAQYGAGPDWDPQEGLELQWPDWFYPADYGWYLPQQQPAAPGRCTYKGEHIVVDSTHLKIDGAAQLLVSDPDAPGWTIVPTGTYCATGSFKIGGNNHKGEITALSPIIQVDGEGQAYTPHAFEMLFFTVPNSNEILDDGPFTLGNFSPSNIPPYPPCYPSPAIMTELNGEDYTWGGIIFNPCGRVKINNKSSSIGTPQLVGTIYGFEVEVNGDDFNMIGTEDIENHINTALVE
jgi:hypothetical protein